MEGNRKANIGKNKIEFFNVIFHKESVDVQFLIIVIFL